MILTTENVRAAQHFFKGGGDSYGGDNFEEGGTDLLWPVSPTPKQKPCVTGLHNNSISKICQNCLHFFRNISINFNLSLPEMWYCCTKSSKFIKTVFTKFELWYKKSTSKISLLLLTALFTISFTLMWYNGGKWRYILIFISGKTLQDGPHTSSETNNFLRFYLN